MFSVRIEKCRTQQLQSYVWAVHCRLLEARKSNTLHERPKRSSLRPVDGGCCIATHRKWQRRDGKMHSNERYTEKRSIREIKRKQCQCLPGRVKYALMWTEVDGIELKPARKLSSDRHSSTSSNWAVQWRYAPYY